MRLDRKQQGFTLMEIVVATGIFSGTLLMILVLLNYTLKINRRVEGVRQATQASRNFAEILVRETRNGKIDYSFEIDSNCKPTYLREDNKVLGLVNRNGDRECFYLVDDPTDSTKANMMLKKISVTGETSLTQVNPKNLSIDPTSFRFYVRPLTSPYEVNTSSEKPGIQPFVTMVMKLSVQISPLEPIVTLPYQTTVSTDIYDIPRYCSNSLACN